jgi:hypothetical protein
LIGWLPASAGRMRAALECKADSAAATSFRLKAAATSFRLKAEATRSLVAEATHWKEDSSWQTSTILERGS